MDNNISCKHIVGGVVHCGPVRVDANVDRFSFVRSFVSRSLAGVLRGLRKNAPEPGTNRRQQPTEYVTRLEFEQFKRTKRFPPAFNRCKDTAVFYPDSGQQLADCTMGIHRRTSSVYRETSAVRKKYAKKVC